MTTTATRVSGSVPAPEAPAGTGRGGLLPAAASLGAAVVLGGVKLAGVLATPWPYSQLALDSDDSRYYLLTALNAAQGAGSTFDGLQVTNGYQPLWFLLLAAAYQATGVDRAGAVVVTVLLLVALWAAAVWLLHRVGRTALGPVGTVAALVALVPHARWWSGCENALAGVALLAVVAWVLGRGLLRHRPTTRDAAVLGVLLAGLALTRVDMLAVSGLLLAVWVLRRWWWAVLVSAAPTVITLGVYAAVNQVLVGSALPVSGVAKQLGPLGSNGKVVVDFLLFGSLGPLPMFFGLSVVVAAAVALVLLGRPTTLPEPTAGRAAELRVVIAVLSAAQLVQVAYYAVASTWDLQGWYFSAGVVALVLSVGVIGARLGAVGAWRRPVTAVLVVMLTAFVAVFAAHEAGELGARDPQASRMVRDIDAGRWADATLPPGAVIAMGDMAATFAWSTAHPVVQLEGLVGSPAYLDALRTGTADDYLAGLGVRYYARLTHPGETLGCGVVEPYFGRGPTTTVSVCGHDVLYRGPTEGGGELVVWDLAGSV